MATSGHSESSTTIGHIALALTSLAAAGIHFAVMGDHFQEDLAFGLFFAVVAWAQVMWAVGTLVSAGRRLLLAGLVGNLAVILIWASSRSSGLPIGPEPWTAEAVGFVDLLSTLLELVIVVGCGLLLARRHIRLAQRSDGGAQVLAFGAFGLALVVLTSAAIATEGDHSHSTSAASGHHGSSEAGHHQGSSEEGHDHGSGAAPRGREHSGPPHHHPDGAHVAGRPDQAQMELIQTSMERYEDVEVARADDYELMDGDYLSPDDCRTMGAGWSPGGEWMTHVWLLPNPQGVFADWNPRVI